MKTAEHRGLNSWNVHLVSPPRVVVLRMTPLKWLGGGEKRARRKMSERAVEGRREGEEEEEKKKGG